MKKNWNNIIILLMSLLLLFFVLNFFSLNKEGLINNRDSVGLNEVPISEIEKLTRMMEEKNNYKALK